MVERHVVFSASDYIAGMDTIRTVGYWFSWILGLCRNNQAVSNAALQSAYNSLQRLLATTWFVPRGFMDDLFLTSEFETSLDSFVQTLLVLEKAMWTAFGRLQVKDYDDQLVLLWSHKHDTISVSFDFPDHLVRKGSYSLEIKASVNDDDVMLASDLPTIIDNYVLPKGWQDSIIK